MQKLFPLASSSKGNSIYIGSSTAGVLIDAGIGPRIFQKALSMGGIAGLESIQAIFITHEHSDHIKGLLPLTERLDVPVYGSRETLVELIHKDAVSPHTRLFEINRKMVEFAGMGIRAFNTSHDSVHSLGFSFECPDGKRAAVCTDCGVITPEVHAALCGCKTLLLESNYDREMLRNGSYPAYLKQRIASAQGHLCNDDCAAELVTLAELGAEHFVLGHLSEENNRPELAAQTSLSALASAGLAPGKDFTLFAAPRATSGQYAQL